MSLNIRASLASATKHANGPMIRKGMRAWGNYDLTYEKPKAPVVWPPVQEA